ncbi:MAG: hypothetical protein AAF563_11635 [Pseudomonadota bacterium]
MATEPIVGTWQGIIIERGLDPYNATLVIESTDEGTSSYPEYDCDARLTLISVDGAIHEYSEIITRGRFRCTDGYLQLTVDGDELIYSWTEERQGDDVIYTGRLQRLDEVP